jgi:hypothetical protein
MSGVRAGLLFLVVVQSGDDSIYQGRNDSDRRSQNRFPLADYPIIIGASAQASAVVALLQMGDDGLTVSMN